MRAKYVLAEVVTGLWRNVTMTIAMMITMAVSLTMLGASLLMYMQVKSLQDFFYGKVEVSIFLKLDVTDDQRAALKSDLERDPLVQQPVIYESRETAMKRFKEQFKDAPDLVNATKPDSLPESYRVKLKDPNQFNEVASRYNGKEGISEIIDQRKLLGKIFGIFNSVQNVALIVAIVQGLAALLLVANMIQIAAFSKRREVAVMKLVGASNWFIQAPFVLEAVFAGLVGAILAFAALWLSKHLFLDGSLKALQNVFPPIPESNVLLMLPVLAGIGAAINAITGWITLRFYVRV
ncbi:permease-like cell division protein FtsX [Planosporangium mesophilum]|uniref:Cell division protein FtsX n=1 Tax=Planosporangium mesophilum TaxID=689768 RepID=A0A8J3TDR5_9ACTN|nr:permease-like cell division protein FtsX [Planosporangium mesophilum]NJC84939.1 ABC transporter permease [Planosporangium mesophilum]GII23591.1 cell division protein FtsX [Planosporangium mesophilum]